MRGLKALAFGLAFARHGAGRLLFTRLRRGSVSRCCTVQPIRVLLQRSPANSVSKMARRRRNWMLSH